jgi:hypothetical protein
MARLLSFFSIATASLRRRQESRFHIFIPTEAARRIFFSFAPARESRCAAEELLFDVSRKPSAFLFVPSQTAKFCYD